MSITLIGWELSCDEAALTDEEIAELKALGTARATLAIDSNRLALDALRNLQGQTGLALADPVAMAVALDPSIMTKQLRAPVRIETQSELTRGMSIVDKNGVSGEEANADVCVAIDAARWKAMLRRSLS